MYVLEGRGLLADDQGLGKTHEHAVTDCDAYKGDDTEVVSVGRGGGRKG